MTFAIPDEGPMREHSANEQRLLKAKLFRPPVSERKSRNVSSITPSINKC